MQRPLIRHAAVILSAIAVAVLAWPVAATAGNASAQSSIGVEPASITSAGVAAQAESVGRGDRGPTVGFWQDRLNVWFGLSGSSTRLVVDGIFGRLTEAATLEFQRSVDGLAADGVVDQVDRVALEDAIDALEDGGAGESVGRGDRGPTVGFWQDRLNVWFGLSGSSTRLVVDGIFGRLTEAATLEFQRSVDGLAADGVVDQVDRVALEDAIDALEDGGAGESVGRGDRGPTVGFWQDRLNVWFGLSGSSTRLVVDGIFGRLTEAATLEFQRSVDGLAADGVVDQVDRVALEDAIDALEDGGAAARNVLVYFLDGEVLAVGGRTVDTVAVATAAMEALLDGPAPGFEQDLGWGTAIPQGTELNGVVISNGTATVDLSPEYESGGGTASVTARLAQVVFTLTQFSTVDEVDVEIDGEPRESITGEGVPSQDLGRDDFLNQSNFGAPIPAILVESPFVGELVGDSLRLAGLSNTFEGTVNYEVTDPDGLIVVDESFITASGGSGEWGSFETVIDLPDFDRDGVASVFVYEISAQDGSRQFLVEVPVLVKASG